MEPKRQSGPPFPANFSPLTVNLFQRIHRSPARRQILSSLRRWKLRLLTDGLDLDASVSVGKRVVLETWRSLPGVASITIGEAATLDDGVRLEAWKGSISLAENVYLGPDTKIYGHGGVTIGRDTLVGMNCCILSSEHTLSPQGTPIRSCEDIKKPTHIGNDVWLGAGVIVLGGITIGDGSVIGAGSVVTSDISVGAICVGSPAKAIRQRETSA